MVWKNRAIDLKKKMKEQEALLESPFPSQPTPSSDLFFTASPSPFGSSLSSSLTRSTARSTAAQTEAGARSSNDRGTGAAKTQLETGKVAKQLF
jgi:hypothetical protein